MSFKKFLPEVKENALQAFENQDYPFDELVQKLDIQRDINQHPLYDVVFAFENMARIDLTGRQLQLKPYPYEPETAKTALRLAVEEVNETIGITLTYATALFRPASAKEIVDNYVAVLEQVVQDRGIQLKGITIDYHLSKTRSCALREAGGDFGF
jgi:non-ribosomal peptide synthetase component F